MEDKPEPIKTRSKVPSIKEVNESKIKSRKSKDDPNISKISKANSLKSVVALTSMRGRFKGIKEKKEAEMKQI